MNPTETLTVADRFALSLEGLCRAVAARIKGGAMQAAMILLVWTRIRRAQGKIQWLLMEFQAGRLRANTEVRVRMASPSPVLRLPKSPRVKLPRRFAWLLPMVPCEAANFSSQLRGVLAEPEMQGLLAASAQARRVLAPVCRMLGIEAAVLMPRDEVPAQMEALPAARSGRVQGDVVVSEALDVPWHVAIFRIRWGGD